MTVFRSKVIVVLVAVVLAVFGNSLANGFVWDDFLFISSSAAYRSLDLKAIFLSLGNGLEYLPVRDLSYLVDVLIWGDNPAGFHLSNVLIYTATVYAVYLFTARLSRLLMEREEPLVPLATALLFAVHPLHSEVVSWVTGRNGLLSGLFFFVAGWLYLRFLEREGKKLLPYGASLAAFVFSLLSKATGITLPLLLVLLLFCQKRPARRGRYLSTVPFFLVSGAVFVIFTRIATGTHIMGSNLCTTAGCWLERMCVALQIPLFYLGKFLLPVRLAAAYDHRFATAVGSFEVLAGAAFLALAGVAALLCARRFPAVTFCVAAYLILLLPVLNLLPTQPTVADRYAYLPSFALCFVAAAGIGELRRLGRRLLPLAVTVIVVASWGALAAAQNLVWRSEKTLWERAVGVSPGSVLATTNLGRIYFLEGDYSRAFILFRRAQESEPTDPHLQFFEGCFHLLRGEYPPAIAAFKASLDRNPDFMEALYNLGKADEAVGEKEEAVAAYRQILRSGQPDPGDFRTLAAEKLARLGR